MTNQSTKAIVNRMMIAYKVNDHKNLAATIGCHANTPSNWIQKRSVPGHVIYQCHQDTKASLDWLYAGTKAVTEVTNELTTEIKNDVTQLLKSSKHLGLAAYTREDAIEVMSAGITECVVERLRSSS